MLAGVVVYLVYVLVTTALSGILGIPIQIALIGGYAACVLTHFTLQRLFVWVDTAPFELRIREQIGRYALVVALQYAATAVATSLLPGALNVPALAVSLAVPLASAVVNFLIFRNGVFHTSDGAHDAEGAPEVGAKTPMDPLGAAAPGDS
jgi:putative flippase GtrA